MLLIPITLNFLYVEGPFRIKKQTKKKQTKQQGMYKSHIGKKENPLQSYEILFSLKST